MAIQARRRDMFYALGVAAFYAVGFLYLSLVFGVFFRNNRGATEADVLMHPIKAITFQEVGE